MLPSQTCELSPSFPVSPEGVVILIFLKSEEGVQGNFLRACRCFIIDCGHVYKTAQNYPNSINYILKMDEKNQSEKGMSELESNKAVILKRGQKNPNQTKKQERMALGLVVPGLWGSGICAAVPWQLQLLKLLSLFSHFFLD